jgi:Fe-S-cluster containining protein
MVMDTINLCKKCQGQCCKSEEVKIKIKDFDDIKKYLKQERLVELSVENTDWNIPLINLNPNGNMCMALDHDGCRIPKGMRPLQCELFPWVMEYQHGRMVFARSKHCKYFNDFPKFPGSEVQGYMVAFAFDAILNITKALTDKQRLIEEMAETIKLQKETIDLLKVRGEGK